MAIDKSQEAIYGLTDAQYNRCYEFFKSNKSSNGLIKVNFIYWSLIETIKMRKGQVKASNSDAKRLLNIVDEDKDGFLTFGQFVDLLNLTFANKRNLPLRIEQYLNNKSSDVLSPENAGNCLEFFNQFYSPDPSKLAKAHPSKDEENIFKLMNTIVFGENTQHSSKLIMNTTKPLKNKEFAQKLAKYYESSLFL